MNKILNEIRRLVNENREMYLPHIKSEALEENGAVYYMNGKNGTEFDWYVNNKISDFFVFYNDENNLGAVKLTLYCGGDVLIYIYDESGRSLIKEIITHVEASEDDIFTFAVLLKNVMDNNKIWDANIDSIHTGAALTADMINEFRNNKQYYEGMINRKRMFGMMSYVSRKVTDEGWKVGYMTRAEAMNENDSGWSFMAGNEDDEYIDDYRNIRLLSIAEVCQLDSEVLRYIENPVGTALIRNSSGEFEIDQNDKEIFLEKRQ
ncbi:MAG: DUF2185 domain-containing protein [Lachnospiraceae bacterium]|nr:DUF2185 domain-containing protein [Lachnospiraceae bacterium]